MWLGTSPSAPIRPRKYSLPACVPNSFARAAISLPAMNRPPASTRAARLLRETASASVIRSSACSYAFERHRLMDSAGRLATGAEPAFTPPPRARWKRARPMCTPISNFQPKQPESLFTGRSTPGNGQAVGRQFERSGRTPRQVDRIARLWLTLGKAVISGSAFGAITAARRSAMTSANDKEGNLRPWHSANAQVKRQAETRELPVYFLVSSWPAALGHASVVAAGCPEPMHRANHD